MDGIKVKIPSEIKPPLQCNTVLTLPTAEILSGKNARVWVSIHKVNIRHPGQLKKKENPGSRFGATVVIR